MRHARSVFLSPSIIDFTLLIVRRLVPADKREMRRVMRNLAPSLPNVATLRIDGDGQLTDFHAEIARLCRGLPKLREVILAPQAVSSFVLRELGMILGLRRIAVAECGRAAGRRIIIDQGAGVVSGPKFPPRSFEELTHLAFITAGPEDVAGVLLSSHFPYRQLTSLWIRFPQPGQGPLSAVRDMLKALRRTCVNLERLVLRFSSLNVTTSLEPVPSRSLTYDDIEPAFQFISLREFCIDHTLPLLLDPEDVPRIARRSSRFRKLWLNPFPLMPLESRLPLSSLTQFALHCPCLEYLGLYLDARRAALLDLGTVPFAMFPTLKQFFVGWSRIDPVHSTSRIPETTELVATYLSFILPASTSIVTLMEFSLTVPWCAVDSDMRACWYWLGESYGVGLEYSIAWKAAEGMACFLRSRRSQSLVTSR